MITRGLKKLIIDRLKADGGWVHSGTLERMGWNNPRNGVPYKPSTVSRILRLLAEHVPGEQPVLLVRYEPTAEYCFNEGSVPPKQVVLIRHPRTGELMTTEEYARL